MDEFWKNIEQKSENVNAENSNENETDVQQNTLNIPVIITSFANGAVSNKYSRLKMDYARKKRFGFW